MRHWSFFTTLLLLLACQAPEAENAAAPSPPYNLVWITAEDLSPRLGCYGDPVAQTPTLDSLAAAGIRYTQAYSVSGVCAPSRAALITGQYPTHIGAQHMRTLKRTASLDQITDPDLLAIPTYEAVPPPEVRCFPELLRAAGYFCTNNSKTDYQFHAPASVWDENGNQAHWRHRPDSSQPFFAVFNLGVTHESQVWARAGEPLTVDPDSVPLPPYYPDHPVIRQDVARHYSNLAVLDQQVQGLLAQLKADGLLDHTIVFFFGDHGDGLPRMKRWVYDSGLKVPLIVRFPGEKRVGTVDSSLVSFVDLAPTMLQLAGVPLPGYLQGQPFLAAPEIAAREFIFAAQDRMDPAMHCRRAVSDGRYKYIRNYLPENPMVQFLPYRDQMALMRELQRQHEAGLLDPIQAQWFAPTSPAEELYDTRQDPHEVHNLIGEAGYEAVLARLRPALAAWVEEMNDPLTLPEPKLIKRLWPPDGEQPQTAAIIFERQGDSVRLASATPGASLMYRRGHEAAWQVYAGPLAWTPGDSLVAKAHRIGFLPSERSEMGD